MRTLRRWNWMAVSLLTSIALNLVPASASGGYMYMDDGWGMDGEQPVDSQRLDRTHTRRHRERRPSRAVTLYSEVNQHGSLNVIQTPWSTASTDRSITTASFVSTTGESIVVTKDHLFGDIVTYLPAGAISFRAVASAQWELVATTPDGVVSSVIVQYDGSHISDENAQRIMEVLSPVLEPSGESLRAFSEFGLQAGLLTKTENGQVVPFLNGAKSMPWWWNCSMGVLSFVGGFAGLSTCALVVTCGLALAGVVGGGVAIGENCGGFMP